MSCWYCSKKGHFKQECRKRIADQNKGKNNPGTRVNQTDKKEI